MKRSAVAKAPAASVSAACSSRPPVVVWESITSDSPGGWSTMLTLPRGPITSFTK